jgi:hypothetical protein
MYGNGDGRGYSAGTISIVLRGGRGELRRALHLSIGRLESAAWFMPYRKTPNRPHRSIVVQVSATKWITVFAAPFTQAERAVKAKGKREAAQKGPARSRQAQGCAFREPSEPNGERGNPAAEHAAGRRVRGEFLWVLSCRHKKVPRRAGPKPR